MVMYLRSAFLLYLLLSFCSLKSQEDILDSLLSEMAYENIINEYGNKEAVLNAACTFKVGMAYYLMEEDDSCMDWMNKAFYKDTSEPAPLYILGMTLLYKGMYENAIEHFSRALSIEERAEFYEGLGDAYTQLENPDKSFSAYEKAFLMLECPDRAMLMYGQLLWEQNKLEEAMAVYTSAKERVVEGGSYIRALYNLGLLKYLTGNFSESLALYEELVNFAPDDYQALTKIIQCHFALGNYAEGEALKKNIYDAQSKGLVDERMNDKFCFDQFKVDTYEVMVYERYEENDTAFYNKHIFYVNLNGEPLFSVQTENSPISMELSAMKYAIGCSKGSSHSTYDFIPSNISYDELKSKVVAIIKGEKTAMSSSEVHGSSKSDKKKKKKK